jgi:lycopene beta-cyclase
MPMEPLGRDDGYDLVLVGGGLQNGLAALRALHSDPMCRIAVVEAGPSLGGNHTWCVHAGDVPESARSWFEPLVVTRWPAYDVCFPGQQRTLASSYAYVSSERFARVVADSLAERAQCSLILGVKAVAVKAGRVCLEDGRELHGRVIVDARGPEPSAYAGQCGYQKFVGQELELRNGHGVRHPIMMDARCAQLDGFRFFYVLPLSPTRLLVEETRFSLSSALSVSAGRAEVQAYAARFGEIASVVREEIGVLPMPWAMAFPEPRPDGVLVAGYRGGFFHPATGYSLPVAVRFAESLCKHLHHSDASALPRFLHEHRSQATFALHLNRLLFTGFAETDMWGVLARFYRLSEPLIERFYAMSSTTADRFRILGGRPPRGFSLVRALSAALRAA